ncbi:hypothetical protein BDN72DRAFT_648985 [Pluteus cervinus]|uniref:Uncharacterized protein n=1 Tax=Pluteus cervinus TaxID=181527 RepID=A0ACD3ATD5_9AGAR|nr:hypothetical protein BDN72DRAFT_648985 [Pluteus cervinus]
MKKRFLPVIFLTCLRRCAKGSNTTIEVCFHWVGLMIWGVTRHPRRYPVFVIGLSSPDKPYLKSRENEERRTHITSRLSFALSMFPTAAFVASAPNLLIGMICTLDEYAQYGWQGANSIPRVFATYALESQETQLCTEAEWTKSTDSTSKCNYDRLNGRGGMLVDQ